MLTFFPRKGGGGELNRGFTASHGHLFAWLITSVNVV